MEMSIVIPVYNGAGSVGKLVDRLMAELPGAEMEVVLVNDCSPDESRTACLDACKRHGGRVRYVELARNFGEHNAVMAGLHYARGDYVVIMDDDFQNPPDEVPRLVNAAKEQDLDVVYTRYQQKRHSWWRNLGSRFNGIVANFMLGKPRDLYLSSFKCISRFAVEEVKAYRGPYPYIDGLLLRATSRIGVVDVRHEPRRDGESNYTLRKLIRLWLNMFVNFSVMPLRASAILGLIFSAAGLVLAVCAVVEKILYPSTEAGWASLMVAVIIFSGVQLVILGLMGEYLGRLFLSVNETPQFTVREAHGTDGE